MSGTGSVGTVYPGVTPVDLYRYGNSSNARMGNVRPQDATQFKAPDGTDWVKANTGRGISCSGVPSPVGKQWWLPAGTQVPPLLALVNNRGTHWQWEPTNDIRLASFRAALVSLHPFFK
jgi:hypothetical protein